MGTIAVMDHTGDSKIIFDKDNADEVSAAREHFKGLRKKGFLIYKAGIKGEQVNEFDPLIERYIAVPPMVGG